MDNSLTFEQLNSFYIGKEFDLDAKKLDPVPLLYKNKNFTTHAAIIGMTGSGKTGLGISLIEEAAMDNIPVLVIDPKGDMGNLMLAFPELSPEDFRPWIDKTEAMSKEMSPDELARKTALQWKKGLSKWNIEPSRIKRYLSKVRRRIFTPGSKAGIPISILGDFSPPDSRLLNDPDSLNSLIDSTTTSLLALAGIESEPLKSREHLLLSSLFLYHWKRGQALTMESLIGEVINPPFEKLGVLPLETIYPSQERMKLAMAFNTVLASPRFSAWLAGEPLEINRLLYSQDGKPCISIFSIAHLSESERFFFVSILLGRFLSWLRRQQGSSSLKTLLYMDEISGYFPPVAVPPTKRPMLLLLKQARAYGAGIILATQNPGDLDYKGLSNIGTWFIGRLQTRQDQDKVIEGLKSASVKGVDESRVRALLSSLPKRTFLMRSVHLDKNIIFKTRWVMSFLRGPLTLENIRLLAQGKDTGVDGELPGKMQDSQAPSGDISSVFGTALGNRAESSRPIISKSIPQFFHVPPVADGKFMLEPYLVMNAKVRFFNSKRGIDIEEEKAVRVYLDPDFQGPDWEEAEIFDLAQEDLSKDPPSNASFAPLPSSILGLKSLSIFIKSWKDFLYQNSRLKLYRVKKLKIESVPGETLEEFKIKVMDILKEQKAQRIEKLQEKYEKRYQRLEEKLAVALNRLEREKEDVSTKSVDTAVSFGVAILGALFGRKALSSTTASRTGRGIRSASRIMKEKQDVKRAEDAVERIKEQMEELESDLQEEIELISQKYDVDNYDIESFFIRPKRSDIVDAKGFILWEAVPQF